MPTDAAMHDDLHIDLQDDMQDNMQGDPLSLRYGQLREELNAAYTAAVWDSQRIDRIAAQLLTVEQALAAAHGASPQGAPENFVRLSPF